MLPQGVGIMIAAVGGLLLFFFLVMSLSNRYNLTTTSRIKQSDTVSTERLVGLRRRKSSESISTSTMSRINGARILTADQRSRE